MSRPRFELRTFCVSWNSGMLDRCDNQLHHRPTVGQEFQVGITLNKLTTEDLGFTFCIVQTTGGCAQYMIDDMADNYLI